MTCVIMTIIRFEPSRRIPCLLAGALCLIAGCGEPTPDDIKQVSDAEKAYRNGQHRDAVKRLDKYLAAFPEHPSSAEPYYLRAMCNTHLSNKVQAESDARHCIRLTKSRDLSAKAHATLATLLYEANRTAEAIPAFQNALAGLPDRSPKDLLTYRFGLCLQREGRWVEARKAFSDVYSKYPGTETSQNARRMHDWKHDFYAIQCGAYRDRGSADDAAKKLKAKGAASWVDTRPRTGETIYTVLVGRYPTYKQARDGLRQVQRHQRDAIIVP